MDTQTPIEKFTNKVTEILYKNSIDDSEALRIKFEKIQDVIDLIVKAGEEYRNQPAPIDEDGLEDEFKSFSLWYYAQSQPLSSHHIYDHFIRYFKPHWQKQQQPFADELKKGLEYILTWDSFKGHPIYENTKNILSKINPPKQ